MILLTPLTSASLISHLISSMVLPSGGGPGTARRGCPARYQRRKMPINPRRTRQQPLGMRDLQPCETAGANDLERAEQNRRYRDDARLLAADFIQNQGNRRP